MQLNTIANTNTKRVMESGNHFKNGASLKSQMSRGNFILFAVLAIITGLFTFNSCSSEEEKQEPAKLEVSTTSMQFEANEGVQNVSIMSNGFWSLSSSTDWCLARTSSGNPSGSENDVISVSVKANTSTASRNATITVNLWGGSDLSRTINISQAGATPGGGGGGDTKPNTPTGVSASQSGSSVIVSWNSVSGATNYNVYRSNSSSGTYSQIGNSSSTNYADYSPLSGYNYYKVSAVNNVGESSQSSYASVNYSGGGGGATKPNAPTGVTATNVGSALIPEIRISWNSVSDATSYKVYRSSSASGTYSQIGSSTSYTQLSDISPLSGSNYYKVKAVNSAGESDYSNYVSYNNDPSNSVAPCPVTYGNCTVSGTTITMRWTVSTAYGCGTPTRAILRVKNANNNDYNNLQTLSGTATSVSFNCFPYITSEGYVYVGIILENDKGGSGGVAKVYDTKNNKWIN